MSGFPFCKRIFSLLLIASLILFNINGQQYNLKFKHLTNAEGLGNNNVLSICVDYKGFLWIGTEDGLDKYDGYGFTIYRKEENNPNSLSQNYCWTIYEDNEKNLWIGSRNGLNLYNREYDNFNSFFIDSAQKLNKTEYFIQSIFEDSHKHLWIGTSRGLFQFDRSKRKFDKYHFDKEKDYHLENERFVTIVEDKEGSVWLGIAESETSGLIQLKDDKIVNIFCHNPADINSVSNNNIRHLFVDSHDNLWIGTRGGGLNKFIRKNKSFEHYFRKAGDMNSLTNDHISSIRETPDKKLWIGTLDGLNILDPKSNKIVQVINNPYDKNSLLSNIIHSLYIDKQGTVWIGSRFGGVDIFDSRINSFALFNYKPKSENTISNNNITSFTEDKNNNIWIATDGGGFNYFNPSTNKFLNYTADNSQTGLINNKTLSLTVDRDNILWVGSWLGGINKFEIINDQLKLIDKYPVLNAKFKNSNCIYSIFQSRNNDIWVGCWLNGLFKYNKNKNTFEFVKLEDNATDQPPPIVDCINEDHIGNLWVGTEDKGLFVIENADKKIKHYSSNEFSKNGISSSSIYCILEDKRNLLWFGTEYGLNLFILDKKEFKIFLEKDGLPGNNIYGILEDNHGNLWISTNNGLSKLVVLQTKDSVAIKCINFDISDGLQGLQFNRWAYFKSRNGEMYFGGNNGFNKFFPDSIIINNYLPAVYFTGLYLFNKLVLPGNNSPLKKAITETNELELTAKQKVITLKFAAINYINPDKNEYKYKLEGFDKDWNYIGNKHEVTYTNLPHGSYLFKVQASNNNGVWNSRAAILKITIRPPFWNTFWFKALLLLIIISSLVAYYFYKIIRIRVRNELLEKLVKERTREVNIQKEKIEKINLILTEQKNEMETQAEELQSQAEELYSRSQLLENSNKEILLQRDDLEKTYEELNKYREQLEDLVIERTRDLIDAKEKAEESDKLKSAFLANISHEIRTPLNAVVGFAKILNFGSYSEKEKVEFIHIIEQNCNYLLSLVDDILDISKIEAGTIRLNKIPVMLNQVLKDINLIYSEEVKKLELQNISISFSANIPDEVMKLYINVDTVKLRQIITNLVNNALKFTKEGYVEFGCKMKTKNMLEFYVKDTGLGIKKEYLELIFDRFRKFEVGMEELIRGTGLGLTIAKQLVELMGGKIWVESEYGKGSVFYFTLPVSNA